MKYGKNSLYFNKENYVMEPNAAKLTSTENPRNLGLGSVPFNLRYGNYYHQILPFYEVFGADRMIFLDGTNMGTIQNIEKNLESKKFLNRKRQ